MFCPIINCDGFARKNNNQPYNVCNMGHTFCVKCGELWHEDGKCKEEEEVDKLFEEYHKKYRIRNCPYCNIVTIKRGGCNHINCIYCGKHWCWICGEIFESTEEHYGNENSKCFDQMNANFEILICSKCENEIPDDNFRSLHCDHIICKDCYIDYLLNSCTMKIYPAKVVNCIISGCNGNNYILGDELIQFINESNNEKLIKKYKKSFALYELFIVPFLVHIFRNYMKILFDFYRLIFKKIDKVKNGFLLCALEIIGYFFALIFIPIYMILIPISVHYPIKKVYYDKLIPEIRNKYDNKIILISIIFGEIILTLVFIFSLMIFHYIIIILFIPIFGLILIIRNIIYKMPICTW